MARTSTFRPIVAPLRYFIVFICVLDAVHGAYFGKFLGKLSELHHGVSGEVFAVDARTLYLKDFTYDGQGPAAYFYAGNSRVPGSGGFRLRDENGSPEVIRRYRREGVTLTLPEGKTLNNIKWFSIWCEEFTVNFGDVKIPRNFDYPRPRKIDALRGVHGISSDNIVIVDAQTLLVPNLSYDGEAPDAKFWVGRGPKPSPQGVRVPDENGKEVPLRRYDRKTVVLTLPGDLTVFDIGHFGIWCEAFTVDFGHIQVPQGLNVPPSLKMLGVSPQKLPRGFDYTEVSRPQAQLVGGHVEATTYRPSQIFHHFAQRRTDTQADGQNQHGLVNRDLYSQNLIVNQQPIQQRTFTYTPFVQQQPLLQQQHFIINQQMLLQQQNLLRQRQAQQVSQYELQKARQFFPVNFSRNQPQSNDPQVNHQTFQNQRYQEQLRAQLNRQYNRFDLSGSPSSNNYVVLG